MIFDRARERIVDREARSIFIDAKSRHPARVSAAGARSRVDRCADMAAEKGQDDDATDAPTLRHCDARSATTHIMSAHATSTIITNALASRDRARAPPRRTRARAATRADASSPRIQQNRRAVVRVVRAPRDVSRRVATGHVFTTPAEELNAVIADAREALFDAREAIAMAGASEQEALAAFGERRDQHPTTINAHGEEIDAYRVETLDEVAARVAREIADVDAKTEAYVQAKNLALEQAYAAEVARREAKAASIAAAEAAMADADVLEREKQNEAVAEAKALAAEARRVKTRLHAEQAKKAAEKAAASAAREAAKHEKLQAEAAAVAEVERARFAEAERERVKQELIAAAAEEKDKLIAEQKSLMIAAEAKARQEVALAAAAQAEEARLQAEAAQRAHEEALAAQAKAAQAAAWIAAAEEEDRVARAAIAERKRLEEAAIAERKRLEELDARAKVDEALAPMAKMAKMAADAEAQALKLRREIEASRAAPRPNRVKIARPDDPSIVKGMAKDAAAKKVPGGGGVESTVKKIAKKIAGKGRRDAAKKPVAAKAAAAIDASNNIVSDDPAPNDAVNVDTKTIDFYDMSDTLTPYVEAWEWQKTLVDARLRSLDPKNAEHEVAEAKRRGDPPPIFQDRDCLILVQHPPVVTLGTGSTSDNLKFDPEDVNAPFAVHRTERGGEATYHGPGQLVIYPVFNLREHQTDLHWYMRSLEEVAIKAMRELGVENPGRVEGLTGAWANVPPSGAQEKEAASTPLAEKPHKVAAIGVRARRWVTYHGMAFNVCPDLNDFTSIVPCGIGDRPVGSIAQLLAKREGIVSTEEGSYGGGGDGGGEVFEDAALMSTSKSALLKAFESVFKVDLNKRGGPPPLRALKAGDKIKCDSCRYLC